MTRKKGLITAAEHMALLRKNPEWVARNAESEARLKEAQEQFRKEQAKLLMDLKDIGFQVRSVWDFVNTADKYPTAIPVLLGHVTLPYSTRTREGIVRALSVNYAGPDVLRELIRQFREEKDNSANSLKWVLGNAISAVATPADAETIIGLATDPAHGEARDSITLRLPRVVKDKARLREVLQHLIADKQTERYARLASREKNSEAHARGGW
jgi:hypothetical protein